MKHYQLLFIPLLIGCGTLYSEETETMKAQRDFEIRVIEGQLNFLERVDVESFISATRGICFDDPPLNRALSMYTDACAEERRLLASGIGEKHPRLESVRIQRASSANEFSARIAVTWSNLASRLSELRKESGELDTSAPNSPRKAATPAPPEAKFVTVAGGVRVPQRVHWSTDLTLMSIIDLSGGFGWKSPKQVFIVRGGERIPVLIRPIEDKKAPDPKVQPGDRIEVPE